MSGSESTTGPCRNVGLWVAFASNVGWLLILSYIVSMVHSEYAQLNKDQAKIAATIKTMPDEWHDKSHGLEVNQSTLFHKLFDLQQTVKNLTDDFMQLREYMQQQQVQVTDVARLALLENSIADFGAALKSLNSDIDSLKNRSTRFGEAIATNTEAVAAVQRRLNETTTDASGSMTNNRSAVEKAAAAESEEKIRAAVAGLKNVTERLDQVNATFTIFATTEREKVINDLKDSVANITAQDVNQAMKNYQEKIAGLESRMASVEKIAETLEQHQRQAQVSGLVDTAVQRLQPHEPEPEKAGDKKTVVEEVEANNKANKTPSPGPPPRDGNGREGVPIM